VNYLLDTNVCIALINGRVPVIRSRFEKALASDCKVLVSCVVAFELWYGVAKSARQEKNARLVDSFFAGPVSIQAFEFEDAKVAGRLRGALEVVGKPIRAYDLLIAAQALRHQLMLVTANGREFGRIAGLDWQDWSKA
jgi:tRNA(fMet)-specific endonuclease VapC